MEVERPPGRQLRCPGNGVGVGAGGWGGVGRGVRDLGEKNGRSCAGRVMPSV